LRNQNTGRGEILIVANAGQEETPLGKGPTRGDRDQNFREKNRVGDQKNAANSFLSGDLQNLTVIHSQEKIILRKKGAHLRRSAMRLSHKKKQPTTKSKLF